ncbi:MAG: beta strand repeat-containing protein [Coprobacillaceae bacterium]
MEVYEVTDKETLIQTTTTDEDGAYIFEVEEGNYVVKVVGTEEVEETTSEELEVKEEVEVDMHVTLIPEVVVEAVLPEVHAMPEARVASATIALTNGQTLVITDGSTYNVTGGSESSGTFDENTIVEVADGASVSIQLNNTDQPTIKQVEASKAEVTINGNGYLEVFRPEEAGNVDYYTDINNINVETGAFKVKKLTLNDGRLKVTGPTFALSIMSESSQLNDTALSINGGAVLEGYTNTNYAGYGFENAAIYIVYGNLELNDGNIIAESDSGKSGNSIPMDEQKGAIFIMYGNVNVNGGTISASCYKGMHRSGVYVYEGDINVIGTASNPANIEADVYVENASSSDRTQSIANAVLIYNGTITVGAYGRMTGFGGGVYSAGIHAYGAIIVRDGGYMKGTGAEAGVASLNITVIGTNSTLIGDVTKVRNIDDNEYLADGGFGVALANYLTTGRFYNDGTLTVSDGGTVMGGEIDSAGNPILMDDTGTYSFVRLGITAKDIIVDNATVIGTASNLGILGDNIEITNQGTVKGVSNGIVNDRLRYVYGIQTTNVDVSGSSLLEGINTGFVENGTFSVGIIVTSTSTASMNIDNSTVIGTNTTTQKNARHRGIYFYAPSVSTVNITNDSLVQGTAGYNAVMLLGNNTLNITDSTIEATAELGRITNSGAFSTGGDVIVNNSLLKETYLVAPIEQVGENSNYPYLTGDDKGCNLIDEDNFALYDWKVTTSLTDDTEIADSVQLIPNKGLVGLQTLNDVRLIATADSLNNSIFSISNGGEHIIDMPANISPRVVYTVTYEPGTQGTFTNQVYNNVITGSSTPTFSGTPTGNAGYVFNGWSPTVASTVTANATYVAQWTAATDTAYTVEHYQEQLDGSYIVYETENLTGTTDTLATAIAKSYTGFTLNSSHSDAIPSGTIAGDGSLVLKLYYARTTHTVTYEPGTYGTFTNQVYSGVKYGSDTPAFSGTPSGHAGYIFDGWSPTVASTVTGNATYVAQWRVATDTAYTVEHYQEQLDGSYIVYETENLTGTTDTLATAIAKSYTGFTLNDSHVDAVPSGTIAGDGSLVLKLYYVRTTHTVTYEPGTQGAFTNQVYSGVKYGLDTPAFNGTPIGNAGYVFNGWNPTVASTVTGNMTYIAQWVAATDTVYTVKHYQEQVDGSYIVYETENLTGTTDTLATAIAKSYTGFTLNFSHSDAVPSGTITGDGSLVLKLYYDINEQPIIITPTEHPKPTGGSNVSTGDMIEIMPYMSGVVISALGLILFMKKRKELSN